MKKALSLVLALMMLMTMCVVPVMAEEPEGSASNPYQVPNPMTAPNFITIPANSTVYYQYNPMIFNGWTVSGYGLTAIVVDGIEYAQPNMWGEIEAPFNFNFMSPGIVGYVNGSDEEVQVMLQHGQPVGTIDNPAELMEGDNAISIPASIMDYVSIFVPMVNGDYTFSTEQVEDFQVTVFTNGSPAEGGTPNPVEGGSLTLTLESYLPVYVVTTPVGMTGDITLTVTAPKAGTEGNPIWMEVDTPYTLEGTAPLYFQVDGFLAGNTLLIESFNGTDLTVSLDGVEYVAKNGALYLPLETDSWVMEMVISQADSAENTVLFSIQYAEGTEQNPIDLELGDNKISIPEGGYYYYEYTVESKSLLTITPADAAAFGMLDAYSEADTAYAYLQEGASSVVLPVSAGATVLISASGVMNEETWVNGAVDTVLNIAVKDLVLYSDFESGDADGWSTSSALSADDVDYISGWYSGKFEVTADWGNIYRYLTLEANTDYVISFKAKAALDKGAWVKLNNNWAYDIAQAAFSLTTEWADYEFTLNSGDHTSGVLLMFVYNGYAADGQIIWLDDVVLTKAPKSEPDGPVAPVVPENAIENSNFDNGEKQGWSSSSVLNVVDNALEFQCTQDWANIYKYVNAMKPNTDYVYRFNARANMNETMNIKVNNNWAGDTGKAVVNVTTEWQTYEVVVNSGDLTSTPLVLFSCNVTAAKGLVLYLDNISIAEVVTEPEPPVTPDVEEPVEGNLFVNGTFEDGNADGWATHQGSAVSKDAAKNGAYGFNAIGNGGWGGMFNQTVAVETGKTYKLSFWIKVVSNGVNIQVKDADGTKFEGSPAGWYDGNKYAEWTYVEKSFVAHADSLTFNVCGAGNGTPESAYLDSITLVQLPDPSFDGYITNGDFEMGDLTGWINLYDGCDVEFVEGYESDTAISITAGSWAQVRQNGIKVEANTDYVLSAWVKNGSNFGIIVKTGDDSGDIDNAYIEECGDWTQYTVKFNSGDQTEICVLLIGWDGGGSAIVDNVTLAEDEPEIVYGDANGDGNVNNKDLGMLQQYLNDYEVEISEDACDVNGDGSVNNKDLGLLQQYLNDWEVELG